MISRVAAACIGVVATGILWPVDTLRANDLRLDQGYGSHAVEPCDPFADDVDAGTDPAACPRFRGRVRVDLGAEPWAGAGWAGAGDGAAPAAVRVDESGGGTAGRLGLPGRVDSGMSRSHLRIGGPDAARGFDASHAR